MVGVAQKLDILERISVLDTIIISGKEKKEGFAMVGSKGHSFPMVEKDPVEIQKEKIMTSCFSLQHYQNDIHTTPIYKKSVNFSLRPPVKKC